MKTLEWKKLAESSACGPHESSFLNLDQLICEILRGKAKAADELVHIHGTEVFDAFTESVLEFIEGK